MFIRIFLFLFPASVLLAQTWNTYHGDNFNTGYAPGMGAISSPVVKWTFPSGGRIWISTPVVGELDGDPNPEVVFGTFDSNRFYALNAEDGSVYWFYQVAGSNNFGTAVIGDVDADGQNEVVCPFNYADSIICLEGDGTRKWGYLASVWTQAPCKLADVDNDGKPEVITTDYWGYVYALNAENGSQLWRVDKGTNAFAGPVITPASINAGTTPDVIVASHGSGSLYALEGSTGAQIWANASAGDPYYGSPTIANITPDASFEVIACNANNGIVYCLNVEDGSQNWRYPSSGSIGGSLYSTPAVADLNGDGDLEIVFGCGNGFVYALNPDGTLFWSRNLSASISYSSAAICDIDGDTRPEVLIGTAGNRLYCLNGEDGTILWNYLTGNQITSSPVPVDADGDGNLGVLIGSHDYNMYLIDISPTYDGSKEEGVSGGQWLVVTPGSGGMLVRFALTESSPVSLDLYDISGALVCSASLGQLDAGEHSRFVATARSGVLFLVLTTPGGSRTATCVIPGR